MDPPPQLISPSSPQPDGSKKKGSSSSRSSSNVVLADTFPAKTHLLVTVLTEDDPEVCAFSPDGTAFHIFDQATFSQKYLPQYFKHSNYGSFVRQLNLYGFTSTRLKVNSDVIVWSHEYFLRDRKDLLKKIKRAKKQSSKTNKSDASPAFAATVGKHPPSHVSTNGLHRVASPSLSEGGVSDTTVADMEQSPAVTSSSSPSPSSPGARSFTRQVSGAEHEWFQSEFAYLKRQNRHLEQKLEKQSKIVEEKLELILKLTLRLGPDGHGDGRREGRHDYYAGHETREKRRRMISDVEETKTAEPAYYSEELAKWSRSVDVNGKSRHNLGTIREETKVPFSYHQDLDNLEPMPYRSSDDETKPAYDYNASSSPEQKTDRGDSFQDFIDVMLKEEEFEEEARHEEKRLSGRSISENSSDYDTEYNDHQTPDAVPGVAAMPSTDFLDDDELMVEAIDSILPELSDAETELIGELQNQQKPDWIPVSNATMDKTSGPEPIAVVSSNGPRYNYDDIEGANVGVTVVSATRVENETDGIDPTTAALQQQRIEEEQRRKRHRKRIVLLLGFVVAAVIAMAVAIPTILVLKHKDDDDEDKDADTVIIQKCPKGGCKFPPHGTSTLPVNVQDNGKGGEGFGGYGNDPWDEDKYGNGGGGSWNDEEDDGVYQAHIAEGAQNESQQNDRHPSDTDDSFYKFEEPNVEDVSYVPSARRYHIFSTSSSSSGDYEPDKRFRPVPMFNAGMDTLTFNSFSLSIQGTDFVCTSDLS